MHRLSLTNSAFIEEISDVLLSVELAKIIESTGVNEKVDPNFIQNVLLDDYVQLNERPTGAPRGQTRLSLRAVISNLFHDRRGKLSDACKAAWKKAFQKADESQKKSRRRRNNSDFPVHCVKPLRSGPDALHGVVRNQLLPGYDLPELQGSQFRSELGGKRADFNQDSASVSVFI